MIVLLFGFRPQFLINLLLLLLLPCCPWNLCFNACRVVSAGEKESAEWQRLRVGTESTLLFSAHLDTRWSPAPLVQVIGVSSDSELGGVLCRLWFGDSSPPRLEPATIQFVSETHERRYVDHAVRSNRTSLNSHLNVVLNSYAV